MLAASPLVILYFLTRALRDSRYWGTFPERLGFLSGGFRQTGCGAVWVHAVSVGEILAAGALLERLRAELPEAPLFVSTTTLAGRGMAERKLAGLADGVFYAPIDYVSIVRRVLRTLRPSVVVVLETEIWPNLFRETRRAGCGLLMVNGRISDRAMPRYRRWRMFFGPALELPQVILAQSESLRARFLELGAPADRCRVGGNLKYDIRPGEPSKVVAEWVRGTGAREVWIAASTMPPDEESTVIAAFERLRLRHTRLLLILAPRKPERFDLTADKLREAGIPFARRSAIGAVELPGVLLLDSIGELAGLFALADVVFMGGSIVTHGGHNVLEPAVFAKPIVCGPHMQNFRDIDAAFRAAGAIAEARDAESLAEVTSAILSDPARARELGERARRCAESEGGATGRAIAEIRMAREWAVPSFAEAGHHLRWPLARVWEIGGVVKRAIARPRRLDARVVSVGNLTMGGTGKTPFVLWLAERVERPGVLTRGYRRESSAPLIIGPGGTATVEATGDEAQLYLRAGLAAGIDADRARSGRELIAAHSCRTLILDDGFQHAGVERDCDIVLIDALDPFSSGDCFPNGRLREPLRALGRASAFVITRADGPRPGIERALAAYGKPVFMARTEPVSWVNVATGNELPPEMFRSAPVAAFCGLGNPDSFWRTLRGIGIEPAVKVAFPDHARYSVFSLKERLCGYEALLTTEKDVVKMGAFCGSSLYWLKTRLVVEREEELLALVSSGRTYSASGTSRPDSRPSTARR